MVWRREKFDDIVDDGVHVWGFSVQKRTNDPSDDLIDASSSLFDFGAVSNDGIDRNWRTASLVIVKRNQSIVAAKEYQEQLEIVELIDLEAQIEDCKRSTEVRSPGEALLDV